MKRKLFITILMILVMLMGCHQKAQAYPLKFSPVSYVAMESLNFDQIDQMVEEKVIDNGLKAFIFQDHDGEMKGGVQINGRVYGIGQLAMENPQGDLMGIQEVQVFGKKAVKIYGALGADYLQAFYWFVEENPEASIIQVDGHTMEIDLDGDDGNEILATFGTIPKTKVYMFQEDSLCVADLNESLGAESVALKDIAQRVFEVYFEPNKPEQWHYDKGALIKQ